MKAYLFIGGSADGKRIETDGYGYYRQSDGTAAPEPTPENELNGGCHAQLVRSSSFIRRCWDWLWRGGFDGLGGLVSIWICLVGLFVAGVAGWSLWVLWCYCAAVDKEDNPNPSGYNLSTPKPRCPQGQSANLSRHDPIVSIQLLDGGFKRPNNLAHLNMTNGKCSGQTSYLRFTAPNVLIAEGGDEQISLLRAQIHDAGLSKSIVYLV